MLRGCVTNETLTATLVIRYGATVASLYYWGRNNWACRVQNCNLDTPKQRNADTLQRHQRQPYSRTICRRRDDVHDECRRSTSSSTLTTPDHRPQHRRDDHKRDRAVILINPLVQHKRATRPIAGDADCARQAGA